MASPDYKAAVKDNNITNGQFKVRADFEQHGAVDKPKQAPAIQPT